VILREGEDLIVKGASWAVVVKVLLTLLPQALGITIPMSLLLGLLIAFGRLSADREAMALQACGVSLPSAEAGRRLVAHRLRRHAHVMIVSVPAANQAHAS
jgi:hypothetical protein